MPSFFFAEPRAGEEAGGEEREGWQEEGGEGEALGVWVIFQLLKYVKLFSFQKSCRLNTFPSLSMYLNTRGSIYDTVATNI